MMGIVERLKEKVGIFDCAINLPRADIVRIIEANNVCPWFIYAFDKRKERWHICKPSNWIARNLPRDSVILETGCGCAFNLIWLGQRGFSHLYGADINREALSAGRDMALLAGLDVRLSERNSLKPWDFGAKIDILLALNWTYHDASFNLEHFLLSFNDSIRAGGHVVIDVIDASYDTVPDNVYLTSDWHLTVAERRPSEYAVRYSSAEVALAMEKAGFEIVTTFMKKQIVPVVVYIARKKTS